MEILIAPMLSADDGELYAATVGAAAKPAPRRTRRFGDLDRVGRPAEPPIAEPNVDHLANLIRSQVDGASQSDLAHTQILLVPPGEPDRLQL